MLMLVSIIMVNGGMEGQRGTKNRKQIGIAFPYGIVAAAIAIHEGVELAAAIDT
jgi:hypothetical protein